MFFYQFPEWSFLLDRLKKPDPNASMRSKSRYSSNAVQFEIYSRIGRALKEKIAQKHREEATFFIMTHLSTQIIASGHGLPFYFRLEYPIVLGQSWIGNLLDFRVFFWLMKWYDWFTSSTLEHFLRYTLGCSLPSNSHHHFCFIFSGGFYRPTFGVFSGKEDNPTYILWFLLYSN